jgi:hypothetical protein
MKTFKRFDCETLKSLKEAEGYKAKLENEGFKVSVFRWGFNSVTVEGEK